MRTQIAIGMAVATLAAGCGQPRPTAGEKGDERSPEVEAAVDRLMTASAVTAEPGFQAALLVRPGMMYDPLTIIPRGDTVWVNDDGREDGERGGRIYEVDGKGAVKVLADSNRLSPPTGFDVAPPGFGAFGGQIFTVSQPRSTSLGTRKNHVILRLDPATTAPAEIFCTLPTHGSMDGGVPGGGLDARFGPAGTPFANRLFAVTIFNGTIYQVTDDRQCTPFATLDGKPWSRPFGIAFTNDGSKMLVAVSGQTAPLPFGQSPPLATGAILAIGPDGRIESKAVAENIERPYGVAVAPAGFGAFGGQVFFTTGGQAPPVGSPQGTGALLRLAPDGKAQRVAAGFFRPTGIAFVNRSIWVADIKGDFIPGQQLPDGTIYRIDLH